MGHRGNSIAIGSIGDGSGIETDELELFSEKRSLLDSRIVRRTEIQLRTGLGKVDFGPLVTLTSMGRNEIIRC
jgi:hypothetical protein